MLRGDFYRLVNVAVYENASLPKVCTAGGFSSSWSASYRDAWRKLVAKARRDHSYAEHSLVDFRWRLLTKRQKWVRDNSIHAD